MVGNQPFYSQFTNLYSVTTLKNPIISAILGKNLCSVTTLKNPTISTILGNSSSSSSSSLSWNLNFHCNLTDLEFVLELKVSLQPHKFRN